MSGRVGHLVNNMAKNVRKVVHCSGAAAPVGPYNQAIVVNNTMYISGQLGLEAETSQFPSDDVADQTKVALKNIAAILATQGASYNNVVKTTILLADINDYAKVNAIYASHFQPPYPARAVYAVKDLPKLGKVEIEAVAVLGEIEDQ